MPEHNITPAQGGDTQAEIDAMVAKAEGKAPAGTPAMKPEGAPERPEWLPSKFNSPEDMAKAYAELEQKQSAPKTPETPKAETPKATDGEAEATANAAVDAAGLDMDTLGAKIVENGDIDASDYEALAKQGISKEMVQQYVAGQQAIGEAMVSRMHASVGGEESFNSLLQWGAQNLSPAEVDAFNNTIDTGSEAAVQLALSGLQARMTAENGKTPNLVGGRNSAGASGDVFRSTAELTAAMGDPRYQRDPAYRADVMAKLDRSNI